MSLSRIVLDGDAVRESFQIPSYMVEYMNNLENFSWVGEHFGCNCKYDFTIPLFKLTIYVYDDPNGENSYLLCKECKEKYDIAKRWEERKEELKEISLSLNSIDKRINDIELSLKYIVAHLDKQELATTVFVKDHVDLHA